MAQQFRALTSRGLYLIDCKVAADAADSIAVGICCIDRDVPIPDSLAVYDIDTGVQIEVSVPELIKRQGRAVFYGVKLTTL